MNRSRVLIGLAALAVLAYANSLPGILFWDSEILILENAFLRSWRFIPEILTTSVMAGAGNVSNYWRPLPVLSLLLQYQAWGGSPLGYHVVCLLVHAANGLLLFLLAERWLGRKAAALAAGLFLLHPIQNETVNYVDHVEGTMACLFGLGSLLAWPRRPSLSAAAFAASLLCKEEGVVFLPILAAVELVGERRLKSLWAHGAVFGVYAVLRMTVFNFLGVLGAQETAYADLIPRLLTFCQALWLYARLLLVPLGLHFDRFMPPAVLTHALPWFAASGVIAGAIGLSRLAKEPAQRLGLLWFAAGLLPYCGLVPFNNVVAEHFLYIPLAGLALYLAPWLTRLPPVVLGVIAAFWLGVNWTRNRDWQSAERIYLTTLAGNPASYRAANNLGVEYMRRGDVEKAGERFSQGLAAHSSYAPALNNMGAVEEARGHDDAALRWYDRSRASDPGYVLAHKNAAGLLMRLGRYAEAEAAARQAVAAHAHDEQAQRLLAQALALRPR